jgi:hypothetical protein
VEGLPGMCFFAKKNIKSGMEFTFDYNRDWVSRQVQTFACAGQIIVTDILRRKKDLEKN